MSFYLPQTYARDDDAKLETTRARRKNLFFPVPKKVILCRGEGDFLPLTCLGIP
jgi:hypothetical protein